MGAGLEIFNGLRYNKARSIRVRFQEFITIASRHAAVSAKSKAPPCHFCHWLLPLAGAWLGLIGCDGPRLYPVQGQVLQGNRPVPQVTVTFHSIDGGPEARGETDFDGKYTLICSNRPGVPAGKYQVTLVRESGGDYTGMGAPSDPKAKSPDEWKLPARYGKITTSGLTAPVPSSPDAYRFVLDPK